MEQSFDISQSRVLLLDLNVRHMYVVESIFKSKQIPLIVATTIQQLFQEIETQNPHLILVDITNPDEEIAKIQEFQKSIAIHIPIPIIIISSNSNSIDITKFLTMGVADYITKPFSPDEFLCRISNQLELFTAKTMLQKQNRELSELNELKTKLFTIIAHDLRGPLGNFQNIITIILHHIEKEPQLMMDYLQELKNSSGQVYELLENLLNWARAQQDKVSFFPVRFDIASIAADTCSLLQASAAAKNITIVNTIDTNKFCVADKDTIFLVMRNLVSNAIKFTPNQGIISMKCISKDDLFEIEIADSGVGMSEETIAKLFNPSELITTWGTNNEKGTGLGIKVCIEYLQKNNSKMWATSKLGEGSSFFFTVGKG